MTKPDSPKVCSSLWRSVAWSRASNAADMSRAVKIVILPESKVIVVVVVGTVVVIVVVIVVVVPMKIIRPTLQCSVWMRININSNWKTQNQWPFFQRLPLRRQYYWPSDTQGIPPVSHTSPNHTSLNPTLPIPTTPIPAPQIPIRGALMAACSWSPLHLSWYSFTRQD